MTSIYNVFLRSRIKWEFLLNNQSSSSGYRYISIQEKAVKMSVAPTFRMNDGNEMPVIGLGTFKPETFQSDPRVLDALEVGYRHFDTAMTYQNQQELGQALRKGFEKFGLKREDVFITSKISSTHHTKDNVVKNCREALKLLQFDYVDLLLIHSPMGCQEGADDEFPRDENGKLVFSDVDYLDTWTGMVECKKLGLAKSIGISNFNVKQMERLMANSSVKPAVNQVESHPNRTQQELLEFCKKHEIIMEAYSPLGAPYTSPGFEGGAPKEINIHVLTDPIIMEIAEKHGKTTAQVNLRWAIQRGTVPLPRSNNRSRIMQNFDVFDFNLAEDEMKAIDGLNKNLKAYDIAIFKDHPHYPD